MNNSLKDIRIIILLAITMAVTPGISEAGWLSDKNDSVQSRTHKVAQKVQTSLSSISNKGQTKARTHKPAQKAQTNLRRNNIKSQTKVRTHKMAQKAQQYLSSISYKTEAKASTHKMAQKAQQQMTTNKVAKRVQYSLANVQ